MILIVFRWSWRPIESRLLTLPWSDLAELTGSSSCLKIKFVEGLTDIEIFGIITGKVDSTFKLAWNFQENRVPSPRRKDQAQNLRNSHRWEHSHHSKFPSIMNFSFSRKNDLSWRRRPWRICHVEGTHKPPTTNQKSIKWYPDQHDLVKQSAQDELSGADIKAICTEAGLLALRERRMKVGFLTSRLYHWRLMSSILSSLLSLNWLSAHLPLIGDSGGLQEVEGECALQEAGGNSRGIVHVDHCCSFCPLTRICGKS